VEGRREKGVRKKKKGLRRKKGVRIDRFHNDYD